MSVYRWVQLADDYGDDILIFVRYNLINKMCLSRLAMSMYICIILLVIIIIFFCAFNFLFWTITKAVCMYYFSVGLINFYCYIYTLICELAYAFVYSYSLWLFYERFGEELQNATQPSSYFFFFFRMKNEWNDKIKE